MEEILSHVGELADPQLISFLLLLLILADTLVSCMWRAKKGESIFSKSLSTGFALNLIGASVPFLSWFLFRKTDSYFYTMAIIAWGVVFGCATIFSLMANYKLYSPQAYNTILANAPKILTSEIQNKINKVNKKKG